MIPRCTITRSWLGTIITTCPSFPVAWKMEGPDHDVSHVQEAALRLQGDFSVMTMPVIDPGIGLDPIGLLDERTPGINVVALIEMGDPPPGTESRPHPCEVDRPITDVVVGLTHPKL